MSHPMPRLCGRFGWKELNSHSLLHAVVLSIWPRGIKALFGSSDLMCLCGKAIHVSRRESKAFKQVLCTPPGGYRRNVVEVQQHTTFPGEPVKAQLVKTALIDEKGCKSVQKRVLLHPRWLQRN